LTVPSPPQPDQDGLPTPNASQITTNHIRYRSQELGLAGKLFGTKDNAPINIAGCLIAVSFLAIFLAPYLPLKEGFTLADMEKSLLGLIAAAFSFLVGYAGGSHKK